MFHLLSFWFALHILLSCQIQIGMAVVFDEYDPYQPVYGNSSLDLQNDEIFFWIGPNNGSLGNLTVSMPGDDENIIAVGRFRYLLKSIQCTNSSVELMFNDNGAYSYAKNAWQWVNVDKNNTFVLIAGNGDCGWNTVRQPFVIFTITFDDSAKAVNLQGNVSTWKNVAHTYELWVGKMPSPPSKFKSRDLSSSINFNHPLPVGSWTFPLPEDASLTLDCSNCGTQGNFDLELHITKKLLVIPDGASITLTANGVGVSITPKLGLTANFTNNISDELSIGTIPIDGINIPGILDVGPEVFFLLGYSIGPVQGSAHISSGISISIQDNSYVDIGIIPPGIKASGWTPTLTHMPMVVDAELSAGVQVYMKVGLELAIEALGHGFVASTYLEPFLGASLSLIESVGAAACPNDPENHPIGVELAPSAGINLEAEADQVNGDKTTTLANVVIASATASASTACFGFS